MSDIAFQILSLRQAASDNNYLAVSYGTYMVGILVLGGAAIVAESVYGFGMAFIRIGGNKRQSLKTDIFDALFCGPVQLLTAVGTIALMYPYGKNMYEFASIANTYKMQANALF